MTKQSGLHLVSKLHTDAALHLEPTTPQEEPGRPRIYGERFNPRQIDTKHLISTEINGNINTSEPHIQAFPMIRVCKVIVTYLSEHGLLLNQRYASWRMLL